MITLLTLLPILGGLIVLALAASRDLARIVAAGPFEETIGSEPP